MFALLFAGTLARTSQALVDSSFDPATGIYQVTDRTTGWSLLGQAVGQISGYTSEDGHDALGPYSEISFTEDGTARASIRTYGSLRAVKFKLEYRKARSGNGLTFPDFSAFPKGLHPFSYRDSTFAPATFSLAQTATPWLLFDDSARSMIFSPANEFMLSRMIGDGKSSLGEGFDPRLTEIKAGMAQESLLVFADGINRGWEVWGDAMRRVYDRSTAEAVNDPIVKKFGYWTDNGADYYYNYDLERGYAETLRGVRDRYQDEHIPLGYMQLDSWWYSKTTDDPSGRPGGAKKNSKLPEGAWNRYGGLYEYRANPDLFPNGLADFEKKIGVPFAVHNRWMDRNSPYHQNFKISGIAVTDPKWWQQTADYLAKSGVTCYEQDWLDPIYAYSPEMASQPGVGDAFTDGMAHSMARHGITLQYCMPTARFFLQGLRYPNLTTIRPSGDRFEQHEWSEFLFGSQFADAVGIRPWCDVFKSDETGNMILSVLSNGPVGTGDALGKESKENILKAALPDGTLVKPDAPLLPCDKTYLDRAAYHPQGVDIPPTFWAATSTKAEAGATSYLFGFNKAGIQADRWTVRLGDVGIKNEVYLYDYLTRTGKRVRPDETIGFDQKSSTIGVDPSEFVYQIAAPILRNGVVFLGDLGKWVPTGKQRVESIEDRKDGVYVRLRIAPKERVVAVDGVAPTRPTVTCPTVKSGLDLQYDDATKRWTVKIPCENLTHLELIVKSH